MRIAFLYLGNNGIKGRAVGIVSEKPPTRSNKAHQKNEIRKTNYRMVIGKAYAFPFAERRKNGLSQKQRATLSYG